VLNLAAAESFSVASKMDCLSELDMRRNLIGDLGASRTVLDALRQRKVGICDFSGKSQMLSKIFDCDNSVDESP